MNTIKNSLAFARGHYGGRKERDLLQEVAEVLAHGHSGEREWQVVARWKGFVLWAPKDKCLLSPYPLLQPKRAGREGVGLERLVKIARLEAAWAFGWSEAMDLVDLVDLVDTVDTLDTVDASERKDLKDQRDLRLRLDQGQRVFWQAKARPLSRRIQPYLGVSRSVPPFLDIFLSLQTAIPGTRSGRADLGDGMDAIKARDQKICLAKGTKGHEKTRKGTDRHEKAQNFGCVCFLVGRTGDSSVPAHLAKKGMAKANQSRLVPLNPTKNLVGEKIIFHGVRAVESRRKDPGLQNQKLLETWGPWAKGNQLSHLGRGAETARNHSQSLATTRGHFIFLPDEARESGGSMAGLGNHHPYEIRILIDWSTKGVSKGAEKRRNGSSCLSNGGPFIK